MRFRNGRELKNYGEPYIVAELNSSHKGKMDIARAMIDAAVDCGCDAVKFQSWTEDSLYCQDYYDKNPFGRRMVSTLSLQSDQLKELALYCREKKIDFASTPYAPVEVDFLIDECDAPYVKVASMDINNLPFLRYIARRNVPIVLSTGMADFEEIEAAVKAIEQEGDRDICILHCVSVYPIDEDKVNLNNMRMLRDRFPKYVVGYSDHTIGDLAVCAAVGMGATLIEKHFTLDSSKIGWDNQMATEPKEMKELVDYCRRVYSILGEYERHISPDETEQRPKMRRSLVAVKDLPEGHIIEEADLTAKRPGDGIQLSEYESIIGCRLLRDIAADHIIAEDCIQKG